MQYNRLGRTDIEVSEICLGTMTWGQQNSEEEGHAQMDFALDRGINFFDTAEMYAIPPRKETYGSTEKIIGTWFKSRGSRDKVILATKIVGPSSRFDYIRDGKPRLTRAQVLEACEASLERLQTDYIDLYQLHWPDRNANTFGQLNWRYDPDEDMTPIEETLGALNELVEAGKVRTIGLSNETAWGVMKFLQKSEQGHGPRVVSNQNAYSLLNRTYEHALAEVAMREGVGLLAYAPIAAGALSGKYIGGAKPEGARMTLFPQNTRYFTPAGIAATEAYFEAARKHGLDPSQMAHAFVYQQPFLTASIVGATSIAQLDSAFAAYETTLSDELIEELEEIHTRYTYPCP